MVDESLKPMITYTWLVDDFAQNHDDACIKTLGEFNDHLVSAVLVGHPLLINDGHIIMNPAIRDAIVHPELSPLQHLIASGYVKILTRNGGDIEALADQMADEGITSAQRLGNGDEYRQRYLPKLHVWMSELRLGEPRVFLQPWPELNTSSIFHKVAASAYRSVRDALRAENLRGELDALRRFIDMYESGEHHRRTDWENIVDHLRAAEKISERLYRELMHAGNEAYQYSWGCALARKDSLVRVETRAPKHTSLDLAITGTLGARRDPVEVYTPDLKVTRRKISHKNWSRLAEVARPGTSTYYAKVEFQRCLEDYYRGGESGMDKARMTAASKKYSRSLSDHFRDVERISVTYDYTTAAGGWALGFPIAALGPDWAAAVGLAIGVASVLAGQRGVPQAMMKVMGGTNKKWIASDTLGARPMLVSNFQIDQQAADRYRRGIRAFKPS